MGRCVRVRGYYATSAGNMPTPKRQAYPAERRSGTASLCGVLWMVWGMAGMGWPMGTACRAPLHSQTLTTLPDKEVNRR